MEMLLFDLRSAVRGLRFAPWLTLAIVVTLAIAIGATTLIFSLVDGVLLNPLAFGSPDRLVSIAAPNGGPAYVSSLDFLDWRQQAHGLDAIAAYERGTANLTGTAEPVRLSTARVSANWFSLLGARVEHGRAFAPDEDRADPARVVVVGDALWRSRFGADAKAVGRTILLDDKPVTVIGVAPPTFTYPGQPDVWIPETFSPEYLAPPARGAHYLGVIARVAAGATFAGARDEFVTITERIRGQYLNADADFHYTLEPLQQHIVGDARRPLLVLLGAVGCVLLIACANIANLLLVRAAGRHTELGVRLALGAGQAAIVRQLLTESLVLALLGASLGVGLAVGGLHVIRIVRPGNLPRLDEVTLSVRVLLFASVITVGTGVLFGLAPMLQAIRSDAVSALRSGLRGSSAQRGTGRLRSSLVMAETAIAVMLLIGAGLLTRSLRRLVDVDPGFRPEQVVRFDVDLPHARYGTWARLRGFTHGVLGRLESLPGTSAAAAAFGVPFGEVGVRTGFHVNGRAPGAAEERNVAAMQLVTPEFFAALGIPIRRGRVFTDQDRPSGHQVVVVNEELVKEYFPGEDPIGQSVRVGWSADSDGRKDTVVVGGEIVGVVGDTKNYDVREPAFPTVYAAFDQCSIAYQTFVVRSTGAPETVLAAARRAVASVDPTVPVFGAQPFAQALHQSMARPRMYAWVVGSFAVVALVLAMIGIYGVLAYTVRERQRELGIRIALGAPVSGMVALVVAKGLCLAGVGLGLGLVIAFAGSRVLGTLLYGVRPVDVATYVFVCAALLVGAVVASWLPARRAAGIDPAISMRGE